MSFEDFPNILDKNELIGFHRFFPSLGYNFSKADEPHYYSACLIILTLISMFSLNFLNPSSGLI